MIIADAEEFNLKFSFVLEDNDNYAPLKMSDFDDVDACELSKEFMLLLEA